MRQPTRTAAENQAKAMDPGIYHNLSFPDYAALPYLNQSVLKMMDRDAEYGASPLHAKAAFDGLLPWDDTDALRLGRSEHCWIHEGEPEFRRRTIVAPDKCEAVTGKGEPCSSTPRFVDAQGRWLCGTHCKKVEVVTPQDYVHESDIARIGGMCNAVRSHEINMHLARPGQSECTIIYDVPVRFVVQSCRLCGGEGTVHKVAEENWLCGVCSQSMIAPAVAAHETTLRHKVRIDRLAEPTDKFPHLITDLKRMQAGEGRRWKRERCIRDYGWDIQAAMYTESVRLHFGVERCHYIWVFVEEKYPHDVVWIPSSRDTLAVGHDKLTKYREEWARCLHLGRWPGYCVGNQEPGGLPDGSIRDYRKRFGDNDGTLPGEAAAA